MNKDFWDKLSVVGTFLSSTLVVVFASLVTYQTNKLSNQVEKFQSVMDENKMINELVKQISSDTSSTVKYDFTLLALERYLRNSSSDGTLKPQDKDMLIGFAQSLILDRKNFHHDITETDLNRILIPNDFLAKYDSLRLKQIQNMLADKNKKTMYPSDSLTVNNATLLTVQPVSQAISEGQSKYLSIMLKKVIYIQYSNARNQQAVQHIQSVLKENKWTAPGIEYVKGNYANTIKYFHDEDREIANEANALLGNGYKVIKINNPAFEKSVPKGQVELWVGN
ncbi:MAG: hypothetical protein H7259_04155 [Cytophagales bacterium]|nr:hypothetical protein [Cytophaga sp.]